MAVNEMIAAPLLSDQATPAAPVHRRSLPSLLVIVAYFTLGIAAFLPALPKISSHTFGAEGDFTEAMWFIGWVPHALSHGLNPFWSNALNVPVGVNLAQNTEAPLLGVLAAPLSKAFSPLVASNLLLMLGMPLSATAGFFVLRKWQVWRPAAALGGLIYGFSPYLVGQSQGHPQLMFLPLPPLIVLVFVSILQGQGNPRRLGIGLGLLVTAQYLVSPELLATVLIVAAVALVYVAIRHPKSVQEIARVAVRPLCGALAVSVVLLSYPVWMLIAGPQHVMGPTFPLANPYHNDLLSFVVPGPLQKVTLGLHSLESRVLGYSDPTEAGGYIGIPLLILSGILVWRSRRSSRTQLAVVLLFVAALFSLGPYLTVDGHLTHIPLPFLVIGHLPLFDSILPSRFNFEVGAFLAVVIAFGLDDMRRAAAKSPLHISARHQKFRSRRCVAFVSVVLITLAVTQFPRWPYSPGRLQTLPASLNRAIPAGDPVTITYPYDTASVTEPMSWQVMDGYRFRLLGGYVYIRGSNGQGTILPVRMSPSGLQQFLAGQEGVVTYGPTLPVTPELINSARTTFSRYHIRMVIVNSSLHGSGPVIKLFTDVLGPPKASSGALILWADWPGLPRQ